MSKDVYSIEPSLVIKKRKKSSRKSRTTVVAISEEDDVHEEDSVVSSVRDLKETQKYRKRMAGIDASNLKKQVGPAKDEDQEGWGKSFRQETRQSELEKQREEFVQRGMVEKGLLPKEEFELFMKRRRTTESSGKDEQDILLRPEKHKEGSDVGRWTAGIEEVVMPKELREKLAEETALVAEQLKGDDGRSRSGNRQKASDKYLFDAFKKKYMHR